MASSLRRNLEDQVTCPICQEHFTDPRLLPCLHTYCKKCLDDLVQAAFKQGQIACPECRQVAQINPGGVDQLKVNFQMNNLISLLAVSSLEQENKKSELLCEYCTSNDPAIGRCVDCCKFMCEFCVNAHKRFLETRDHRLLSLDEVKKQGTQAMSQQPRCAKHKGEVMKLYCESCEELICRDCTIIDHREHCYQFIDDVAAQHKKGLKAALEDAIQARSEIEKTKKLVEDMKVIVAVQHVKVNNEIEDAIAKQISVLRQTESSLKAAAKKCAEDRIKSLNEQAQDLDTKLKNLNGSVQFTQDVLKDDDNVTILSVSSEANNRLSSLVEEMRNVKKQPCEQDDFNLKSKPNLIEKSIADGIIVYESPKPKTSFEVKKSARGAKAAKAARRARRENNTNVSQLFMQSNPPLPRQQEQQQQTVFVPYANQNHYDDLSKEEYQEYQNDWVIDE